MTEKEAGEKGALIARSIERLVDKLNLPESDPYAIDGIKDLVDTVLESGLLSEDLCNRVTGLLTRMAWAQFLVIVHTLRPLGVDVERIGHNAPTLDDVSRELGYYSKMVSQKKKTTVDTEGMH